MMLSSVEKEFNDLNRKTAVNFKIGNDKIEFTKDKNDGFHVKNEVFQLDFTIDEDSDQIKFYVNINPYFAQTVEEVIGVYNLYLKLVGNKFYLEELPYIENSRIENVSLSPQIVKNALIFWKAAMELEQKEKFKFDPKNIVKGDSEEERIFWKVYISLIKDKSYKEYVNVDNIIVTMKNKEDAENVIGKGPLDITMLDKDTLEFWGESLDVFICRGLHGFKIKKMNYLGSDRYEATIEESGEIYTTEKLFRDEQSAREYQQNNRIDLKNSEELKKVVESLGKSLK